MFVGLKMLLADIYKIPIGISLGVVAALLTGSVVASLLIPKKPEDDEEEENPLEIDDTGVAPLDWSVPDDDVVEDETDEQEEARRAGR